MKKICFIAQFPPPMHGLSKAVETLYNSELEKNYVFEKVDITDNKRILQNLMLILFSNADLFYFTISQSKWGNIRDLIILKLIDFKNKNCLIHLHGGYYRTLVENFSIWQKKANYAAIAKLTGAIVLGNSLNWIFKGMIDEKKIFTVPNCVDNECLINDDEFNEKLIRIEQEEVHHVLYLSNFIRSKGYIEVLKMARLEKARVDAGGIRKFHFNFAGKFFEDEEKECFKNYISENMLDGFVTYHGIVGGVQKLNLLKQCSIFVLLTRYPNEGQPISILEAMGNGQLIITTDHAGIPDIVKNKINGLVIDKSDDYARWCYDYCLNIEFDEFKKIIKCNRNNVVNEYMEHRYIENMHNLFSVL